MYRREGGEGEINGVKGGGALKGSTLIVTTGGVVRKVSALKFRDRVSSSFW